MKLSGFASPSTEDEPCRHEERVHHATQEKMFDTCAACGRRLKYRPAPPPAPLRGTAMALTPAGSYVDIEIDPTTGAIRVRPATP